MRKSAGLGAGLQTEASKVKIARVHETSRRTYGSPLVTASLHE
jgi:hypothetical protein